MQLHALKHWLKLAESHPESSVQRVRLTEVYDVDAQASDHLWYRDAVPGFELLDATAIASKYGRDGKSGASYDSVVLSPRIFLPWLRSQLENSGVRFERIGKVTALSELKYLGHDVLVNASGSGSLLLTDVRDDNVMTDRTYVTVVKSHYKEAFVQRSSAQYAYMFSRGDGTVAVGGISEPACEAVRSVEEVRANILSRAHKILPEAFATYESGSIEVVEDPVGIRPLRAGGVRVEQEVLGGQNVVHVYGTTVGGYILSFGLAQEAAKLVDAAFMKVEKTVS
ncbi:hypothetical protein Daus18300_014124 [Diaporthe australafricana]|uniref:FAD dependent oxidoreductase domain-containing protein n=1 Tax=Diaporthe australafricana TaxID=127596 RepID=A0ABR3VWI2_9PEZI